MSVRCPKCEIEIPGADINVAANVMFCRNCNEASALSDLVQDRPEASVDFNNPPPGVWYRQDFDGVTVSATTRSAQAFFLVPFMCVWSGFSLGGIYGSQIKQGKFNPGTSLFGIPFVIGTLIFGSLALMTVCGKVELRLNGDDGQIFTGIGVMGMTKRFKLSEMKSAYEVVTRGKNTSTSIVLEGKQRISFGSMLSENRRYFMLQVLRSLVRKT